MATEYKPMALPECEALVDEPATEEEWTGATVVDWSTGEVLKVHPVAAMAPMLSDDELADLAADIAANGQRFPIILNEQRMLIDGRNRLAACRSASTAPWFDVLPSGVDAVAFIFSTNVNRRHLTKGQQAMWVAMGCLETRQTIRSATPSGLSHQRVGQASIVLQYARDLAEGVLSGAEKLDAAYATAKARKDAASSTDVQLTRLRAEAPDLADLVSEERMTVGEAIAALEKRIEETKRKRKVATDQMRDALAALDPYAWTFEHKVTHLAEMVNWEDTGEINAVDVARLRVCADVLTSVADQLEGVTEDGTASIAD